MELKMHPNEIERDYSQSKHKRKQIQILADRNLCTPKDIADLLVRDFNYNEKAFGYLYRKTENNGKAQEPLAVSEKPTQSKPKKAKKTAPKQAVDIKTTIETITQYIAELEQKKADIEQELNDIRAMLKNI